MCKQCADVRDRQAGPGVARATSSSSSAQMEKRVETLEKHVANLQQALTEALQEVHDLREIVENVAWEVAGMSTNSRWHKHWQPWLD